MSTSLNVAGSNLERVHTHNRRVVLDAVRRAGTLTRAEMARQTHLTAQTINNIVEALVDLGLLVADAPRRGGRGQPSVPYRINPDGAFALGFHVDHRRISGVLVDLLGRIRSRATAAARQPSSAVASVALARMAPRLIARGGATGRRILGAGVAVPIRFGVGPITSAGPTTLPEWDGGAAVEIGDAMGVPVMIENDALAAAIGERMNGVGREIDSYVYLLMNEGLGAGIMMEGQPWRGAGGNAGEIGHMIVTPDGRPCPCGNRGCLERYVSLGALEEHLGREVEASDLAPPGGDGATSAGTLDGFIADAAPRLAQAVGMLEAAFDPETLILGGLVPTPLLERLIAAAPLPVSVGVRASRRWPRIMIGQGGSQAVLLGAAALPIFDLVSPRFDVLLKNAR
jgi:predicted NBD/HSP70 family sugar kinase